jgi:hypothetical protein
VVAGAIVRWPVGGLAWHHLQYVLGLARLGHDVAFIEDSGDDPWECYDPSKGISGSDPTFGLDFIDRLFTRCGLGNRWAFHDAHRRHWFGPLADRAVRICETADVLLNLSEVNRLRPWIAGIPVRVLIDTDPVFNQIHHLTQPDFHTYASQHTAFFTFGENIARGTATVPADGFVWQPTRQPIVLDAWPVSDGHPTGPFTTVMTWESYKAAEYAGVRYGLKAASFSPFLGLPQRVTQRLELSVGSQTAPREQLAREGWIVRDPLKTAPDPWGYQEYIRRSKAEFSVAKHAYHITHCGWFSDRSAAYLATGRPVVVQDTGFSTWLDADGGVLTYRTADEAVAAIEEVARNYARHCRAARSVAETYFDSDNVLDSLLSGALRRAGDRSGAAQR